MTKVICTDKGNKDFESYINLDHICFIKPMSNVYPNLTHIADWLVFFFTNGEQLFVKPENSHLLPTDTFE